MKEYLKNALALVAFGALVGALLALPAGCMTSKTATGATIVNTNNLALDCAIIQSAAAIGTSVAVQKDPTVVPILQNVQVALGGVLNGANATTTAQALQLIGASSNPTLGQEVAPLIGMASALEQQLLAKYGAGGAGQISLAIARALYSGITAGLAGSNSPHAMNWGVEIERYALANHIGYIGDGGSIGLTNISGYGR